MEWNSHRPTIVYDEQCDFCTGIAKRLSRKYTTALVGFEELTDEQKMMLPPDYQDCAHVIIDGNVYSCGEAVEALIVSQSNGPEKHFIELYHLLPFSETVRESVYTAVADNRNYLSKFSCDCWSEK